MITVKQLAMQFVYNMRGWFVLRKKMGLYLLKTGLPLNVDELCSLKRLAQ